MSSKPDRPPPIAQNRRARHDFFVLESFEVGLELLGTEVKSLRAGDASLAEAFAVVEKGEAWVRDMHIAPYRCGNVFNHEPRRPRRLLLHRREIDRLGARMATEGLTLVPLKLYFARSRVKMELGLCKGKRFEDRRETIKRREADLDARRATQRRR